MPLTPSPHEELTTTMIGGGKTHAVAGSQNPSDTLGSAYQQLLQKQKVQWTTYHRFERELGSGGQGVVYLSARHGADGFHQPVAVKVFSPERFPNSRAYRVAMERIARIASLVANIQHDNLLDVQDFVDRDRIRIMIMEWIDGYDLRQLMYLERLKVIQARCAPERWEYLTNVVATAGPSQTRFKAGIAIAVIRECLAALGALHRCGIVHSDIKPANIMLKRSGHAKLIDMGSAFELDDPPPNRACTPTFAAPEVLEGATCTPQSDLASLGYVLVEMLAGRPCFAPDLNFPELLTAKRQLPQQLKELLPPEVHCNNHLMNFCRRLIAVEPEKRFPSAEAAELLEDGAAQFHRQLIFGDLASEYEHDIKVWLEEIHHVEQLHLGELETGDAPSDDPPSNGPPSNDAPSGEAPPTVPR